VLAPTLSVLLNLEPLTSIVLRLVYRWIRDVQFQSFSQSKLTRSGHLRRSELHREP